MIGDQFTTTANATGDCSISQDKLSANLTSDDTR